MKKVPVALALFVSAVAGLASMGAAMPPPPIPAGNAAAIPVAGCHSDVRRHYAPEAGASVRHHHRGGNCRAVIVGRDAEDGGRSDCHRSVRTHRVDGLRLRHRHVRDDCRIREVRQGNQPGIEVD
ncbi:MAG: hypothetical protein H0T56_07460 [Pseudaminobacter sp.]|nr:hypothetical protein [Pseudaminobacter sp.]